MKKLLYLLIFPLIISCSDSRIIGTVVVEQIKNNTDGDFKYEIKLRAAPNSGEVYLLTNNQYQVGDILNTPEEIINNQSKILEKWIYLSDSLSRSNSIYTNRIDSLQKIISEQSIALKAFQNLLKTR